MVGDLVSFNYIKFFEKKEKQKIKYCPKCGKLLGVGANIFCLECQMKIIGEGLKQKKLR